MVLVAVLVEACVAGITTDTNGLRTSSRSRTELCETYAIADPVFGWFRASADEPEHVWLEARDGRRISVVWPAGFRVRFGPPAELTNERGEVVAREGQKVFLGQTRVSESAGTFNDPYIAHGLIHDGCYA